MARPRGRKPKPTHLKLVTDTFERSRANKREAKPDFTIPDVPTELNDDAKLEWGRVTPILHKLKLISLVDRGVLAAYCQAYGTWVQALRTLNRLAKLDDQSHGLLVKTTNGNLIQNPLIGIANKAHSDMVKYATDLGMTPSARSRVQTLPPDEDEEENTGKKFGI